MNNNYKLIAIFVIFLVLVVPFGGTQKELPNSLHGGWIEEIDGITILHVNGSYYDMGYQHGFLLQEKIHENMRGFLAYIDSISSYEMMLSIWNTTKPFVPICYIQEMQGISDGANVPFNTVAACYMSVLFMDMQCFTFAAWGNATKNDTLYHIRSLDFPLLIQDPISGTYVQENSILIVRNPEDGLQSLIPSIAGGINFYQGINEKQISIGVEVCWSSCETLLGTPVKFKIQRVLDTAETLEEAIQILTTNNTLGWNFIVSDGKIKKGVAIEITANQSYVGLWDNPVEGIDPFWQIEDIVRRTNFFIDPTLAATQRTFYDPTGLRGFLNIFLKQEPFFPLWRKYKSMSEAIESEWGNISLCSGMNLMRTVYTGQTDFFMFIFVRLDKQTILCDFQQWGYCPETGEFAISFADANHFSHETDLHFFNINEFF